MLRVSLLMGLAIWLAVGGARAGEPAVATAEALFQAGRDAARRGDAAGACARFRESYRLDRAIGTLLNIAICEEELGQLAGAWQHYEEVIQGLQAGDNRLPIARSRAVALHPRVPRLIIRRTRIAPKDTTLYRGALELASGSFDVPLPLDPGRHEFVARASGHRERKYSVILQEARTEELLVEPGPKLAVTPRPRATVDVSRTLRKGPPAPTTARETPSTQRTAGFIIGGAGVAALAVSGVMGLLVLDRKRVVERECPDRACNADGLAARESGLTLSAMSTVAFVTGTVALGAATYLVLTGAPPPPVAANHHPRPVLHGAVINATASF
jgi:hypothetical protein